MTYGHMQHQPEPSMSRRQRRNLQNAHSQARPSQLLPTMDNKNDSDSPQRLHNLDEDYDNLPFLERLKSALVPRKITTPNIPIYNGKSNLTKHLSNYKTHMNLRCFSPL